MSDPIWAEGFEARASDLLQAAYDHADDDDAVEQILLAAGLDDERRLHHAVAYRIDGRHLGPDELTGAVAAHGDPDRLRAELAGGWAAVFDLLGRDAITSVRLRYDVAGQDLTSDFGYEPVDADTFKNWRGDPLA